MRKSTVVPWLAVTLMAAAAARSGVAHADHRQALPTAGQLEAMAARFAPVEIGADLRHLPTQERAALARLVEASKLIDSLYLRQVWAGNETLLLDLLADASPLGKARLHYFMINKGPWSRLDHNARFVP